MRKMLRVLILALLCAASYTACQRASEEKNAEQRQEAADSVQRDFQSLSDSLELSWQELAAEEEQKLANLRRLLEEISYTPAHTYNQERLDTLQNQLQKVYEMQLDPLTMTSEEIDRYDSVSSQVQHNIIQFARNHPGIEEYPLMDQLIDRITEADRRVLFLRVKYDQYARDYFHFLEGHREYLRDVDTTGLHQERTYFQISE
jgi:exonuclease VII large subunit